MKRLALFIAILALLAPSMSFAAGSGAAALEARRLEQRALARIALHTIEQRRLAIEELEQAARLDPATPDYAIELSRQCLEADQLSQARRWAGGVLARDSSNAQALLLLGRIWRREWLIDADGSSLDRALLWLARAARAKPGDCQRWVLLVPLLIEAGEMPSARAAARLAIAADSTRPDALLAAACMAQRVGDLGTAERYFAAALPRLPGPARARFEDLEVLLPPRQALDYEGEGPAGRRELERRFWLDADPDLVTPLNEARLEFWSRAAHAYALYYDPASGTWDMRGELYVRYGPPRWMDYNPLLLTGHPPAGSWMVWTYPELGMRIHLGAAHPLAHYHLPGSRYGPMPVPYRDSLARHPERFAVSGGWAVFPSLPPSLERLEVSCALGRFGASDTRQLFVQAETPGEPASDLSAEWVVLDDSGAEVARAKRSMSASACDPLEARAASFTADLPAGRYQVGVAVQDAGRRRGVYRSRVEIAEAAKRVALSDVVVTCGPPRAAGPGERRVPLEPDPRARVDGSDPLCVYFEIYNLTPGSAGLSRYEYACVVHSAERDTRPWIGRALKPRRTPPPIEVSRSEEQAGPMRRQFLTIPVSALPSGRYEVEVRVRDLISGERAVAAAGFERAAAPAP